MALPHRAGASGARPARGLPVGALACSAWACSTTPPRPYSTDGRADRGWIARYAWGDDYHDVMKAMLERAGASAWRAELGPFQSRVYVDTGPIVERAYAARGRPRGLGQEHLPAPSRARVVVLPGRGRHRPRAGAATRRAPDMCGSCTACLDACPTGALARPLRARRDALHQLPDHRAARARSRRSAARASAATSSAATSARTSAPGTAGGATRAARPSRPAAGLVAPDLAALAAARRGGVPRALPQAARSSARSGAACCATWPSPSATPATPGTVRCWSGWRADEDPLVREHAAWALRRLAAGNKHGRGATPRPG